MERSERAVLLISCPDRAGIVAAVAEFLYRNGGNIVHADQHTDRSDGTFLQRVEWELDNFRLARGAIADEFRPIAERFGMTWALHDSREAPRVAILASKLQHCLFDLLARWRLGEFGSAEVPVVVSNHEDARPIADSFGVRYACLPVGPGAKAPQEEELLRILAEERIDLVVLARYMQILSDQLIERYAGSIINIHHSFLPAFAGARPYHQAHERGVKVIGATAHYATAELDAGPIIAQDVVAISHRDSVDDLVRKGREVEKRVLARAVDLHLLHRIIVYGNKTAVFD